MNNWQVFVAAGFPTIAVLVGILLNERRADRSDARITTVENSLGARIDRLEGRVDQSETRVVGRIDRIGDDLKTFYGDLGRHEAEIANLKQR